PDRRKAQLRANVYNTNSICTHIRLDTFGRSSAGSTNYEEMLMSILIGSMKLSVFTNWDPNLMVRKFYRKYFTVDEKLSLITLTREGQNHGEDLSSYLKEFYMRASKCQEETTSCAQRRRFRYQNQRTWGRNFNSRRRPITQAEANAVAAKLLEDPPLERTLPVTLGLVLHYLIRQQFALVPIGENAPLEEVFAHLKCSKQGLSLDEVQERLELFGYNKLDEK
ncbi:hypothetical protein RJ639_019161, partial [Escallonia herrerae]